MKKNKLNSAIFFAIFTSLILTACERPTNAPNVDLNIELPAEFAMQDAKNSKESIGLWWNNFQDGNLSQIIITAMENSPDVLVAEQRINAYQARVKLAQADFYPTVGMNAKNNLSGINIDLPNDNIADLNLNERIYQRQTAIAASWEGDLFGKKAANSEIAKYALISEEEKLRAIKTAIAAKIAVLYFDIIYNEQMLKNNNSRIKAANDLINYGEKRFQAGQGKIDGILELKRQKENLQAINAIFTANIANDREEISLLSGIKNDAIVIKNNHKSEYQNLPLPPAGEKPENLLYRRPDLLIARNILAIYVAQRKIALADFYPSIKLNFSLLEGKISLGGDISAQNNVSGGLIGLDINLPIFTAGRLSEQLKIKDAEILEAAEEYRKKLLTAIFEVDKDYRNSWALNKQVENLQKSVEISRKKLAANKELFQYGNTTFDKIATSELELIEAENKYFENRNLYIKSLINLYVDLGGEW
ncbi:MAG: TolC family protein [Cardiobacteriaceae bacterium]|nr:TolC family protein [Cardiobacteriaceae bacterium]